MSVHTISWYVTIKRFLRTGQFLALMSLAAGMCFAIPPLPKLVDMVVFSFDRPLQLEALLKSTARHIRGLGEVRVIYRASSQEYEAAYAQVRGRYPWVQFFAQGLRPHEDFKPLVMAATGKSSNEYIMYAVDDIIVQDHIDCSECVHALEQTGAYAFMLRLGKNITACYSLGISTPVPPLEEVAQGIYRWQFSAGQGDWAYPHSVDMAIFRKSDVNYWISALPYVHPNSLEGRWAQYANLSKYGLCYERSKIVNLPLNIVNISHNNHMNWMTPAELLTVFNQGLEIDIKPLETLENHAPHWPYIPSFVPRGPEQPRYVIIVPSYNNASWYGSNLYTICSQQHTQFRVIYIDDNSTDNTAALVEQYLKNNQKTHLVTLVKNTERVGALANLYRAAHSCTPQEILVFVDGDDWLASDQVLAELDTYYTNPDIWMTYGQFKHFPYNDVGPYKALDAQVIQSHSYRQVEWTTSHLRTCRSWLFNQIKLDDLLYQDDFFKVTWDQAMMFPMLEMAGPHSRFIEKVLYVYNLVNPLNDNKVHKLLQRHCEEVIRAREPYKRLGEES